MPAIYILDVPEYAPVVAYAEARAELKVTALGPYRKISADGRIAIDREATGLGPAVWFGTLVGGLDGEIVEFDEHRLVVGPVR